MSVLLIPLWSLISLCNGITKFVSLTPANPSSNGLSTTLIKAAAKYPGYEWDLRAIDETEFNMNLHLDSTWSFHPKYPTKLTLSIGSDTPTNSIQPTSLIVSFSQNNAKYITSVIEIGSNNDDIILYPPPMNGKQNYGSGNIEQLVSVSNNEDRITKATNNGSYDYFDQIIPNPIIEYPLTFTLENDPNFDYMFFTYFTPSLHPRNIVYFGMDTNATLDIYLSAGNTGDNFDITYLNVSHTIDSNQNILTQTTQNMSTISETISQTRNVSKNTNNRDALVILLISTVGLLCCLFVVFALMFGRMFHKHRQSKTIRITSPKNPMKNEKPLHQNPVFSHTHTPNSVTPASVNINNTPTFEAILNVLHSTNNNSQSMRGIYENKECAMNDVDMDIICNEVMRKHTSQRERQISDPDTITGEIRHEMEEKKGSVDLECLYNAPNRNEIRRATVYTHTPGALSKGSELAIDENVNRISISQNVKSNKNEFQNLRLHLQDFVSGDSELLYEDFSGNNNMNEGTPYGSTDTQCQSPNNASVTPYNFPTNGNVYAANV